MLKELTGQVQALIMPSIAAGGLELIELTLRRRGPTFVVEALVDHPEGGVTVDECSDVNRALVRELEAARVLGEDFEVDVASPGLDRPLKTAKDFLRRKGRRVRVHLREPFDEKWEYSGVVAGADEQSVTLEENGATVALPLQRINKGMEIILFEKTG